MAVIIRLAKTGKKHQISFRVVACDKRSPRDGRFLEILGYYNPYNKPSVKINEGRVNYWVSKGARMSEAVLRLLDKSIAKEPTTNTNKVALDTSR